MDDPKLTLQDVLDALSENNHVRFDVNEKAFKNEHLDDVLHKPLDRLIPAMSATLDLVLRKVLSRIKNAQSGATYLIRKDHIEITTGDFFWAETGPDPRKEAAGAVMDEGTPPIEVPSWDRPATGV